MDNKDGYQNQDMGIKIRISSMGISRMGMYVTGYIGTSSKRQENK